MKNMKILSIMMSFAAAMVFSAPGAYAAYSLDGSSASVSGNIGVAGSPSETSISVSKGVQLDYTGTASRYSTAAFHNNGTREYATANATQTIYYRQCDTTDSTAPCESTYTMTGGQAATWDPTIVPEWTSQ